jgi:hypothetical protein
MPLQHYHHHHHHHPHHDSTAPFPRYRPRWPTRLLRAALSGVHVSRQGSIDITFLERSADELLGEEKFESVQLDRWTENIMKEEAAAARLVPSAHHHHYGVASGAPPLPPPAGPAGPAAPAPRRESRGWSSPPQPQSAAEWVFVLAAAMRGSASSQDCGLCLGCGWWMPPNLTATLDTVLPALFCAVLS